ncbi:MAG: hypothetical protein ACRY3E_05200 [Candidatus Lariskella arthropodorum]
MQVEAHSTKTLLDIIMHLIDYILYKIIGKNVSQYGYSEHRDDFPIHIKFQEESKSQEERAEARKWSEKVQSNDIIELKRYTT